jgi:outer membrane biosynthesis protein TonB
MRLVLIVMIAVLALTPTQTWAKGKSDQSRAGGQSAEHRSEKGQENANPQHLPDAEKGTERAEERKKEREQEELGESDEAEQQKAKRERTEDAKQQRKQKKDAEEAVEESSTTEQQPGFFGRMRRFFGGERSQEQMSEQGREHQRADEQERARGAESSP